MAQELAKTLSSKPRKEPPKLSGPKLFPKKDRVSRQVFLSEEMWRELSEAAEFHSDVFEAMGAKETVSRNDLIDGFLRWALDAYWEDKGGRPTTEDEWGRKVKRHAELLKKSEQQ